MRLCSIELSKITNSLIYEDFGIFVCLMKFLPPPSTILESSSTLHMCSKSFGNFPFKFHDSMAQSALPELHREHPGDQFPASRVSPSGRVRYRSAADAPCVIVNLMFSVAYRRMIQVITKVFSQRPSILLFLGV